MNFLKEIFYPWFVNVASLASIIGIIIVFISNEHAVLVAVSFFCLILLIFLCAALYSLNRLMYYNCNQEYKRISSFFVFQTDDGVHSTFETYRLIQCKRSTLSEIEYRYKWSGKIFPRISSQNQVITQLPPNNNPNEYDKAIIKFPKPLTYNETTVVHLKTENDDPEGIANPRLDCKLSTPIEIIQFRILLAYKSDDYNKHALVKRKKINTETITDFDTIGSITFNQKYKQYFYVLLNPEAGYIYRIEWEK